MPIIASPPAPLGAPPFALYRKAPLISTSERELERYIQSSCAGSEATSQYYEVLKAFVRLESKLIRETRRQPNWNGYGAEPPTSNTIEMTRTILRMLREEAILPRQLTASAEGGVVLCFIEGNRYADIEILNTGDISATMYELYSGADEIIIDLQPDPHILQNAILRIQKHQTGH